MPAEGRFEVVEGAQKGEVVPLAASTVTLGRAPGNGFVVKDAAVSRQHAKIFERDERHFIADLNSSHGTFVNGAKVSLHTLQSGDEIQLGATKLRYLTGAAARPVAPPVASAPPIASPTVTSPAGAPNLGGDFELELPTTFDAAPIAAPKASSPPPPPAPAKPLPPVNPNYRRALTETGEDPFADESAPAAPAAPAAAAPAAKPETAMPSIELRGRTAEHFATRGGSSGSAAARPAVTAAHAPPPITRIDRRRGPLSFLRSDLNQRGGFARLIAALFALAIAGGLLWLTMKMIGSGPKKEAPREDSGPIGPERPSLPPKR